MTHLSLRANAHTDARISKIEFNVGQAPVLNTPPASSSVPPWLLLRRRGRALPDFRFTGPWGEAGESGAAVAGPAARGGRPVGLCGGAGGGSGGGGGGDGYDGGGGSAAVQLLTVRSGGPPAAAAPPPIGTSLLLRA
jgi:hypothetical protein